MIINKIALVINDFINNLYNQGIEFYKIIIGMFIFDFIIYILCKFIHEAKKVKY